MYRYDKSGYVIVGDGRCIPPDPANVDYVAALAAGIAPYVATPVDFAPQIEAACDARITSVVCGKRSSINADMGAINNSRARGIALTDVESVDEPLILLLNAWEADMVIARDVAKRAQTDPALIVWPPLPASITPDWIAGF